MNPKISIIVPVYKVEQYIHKSINSILNQTFKDFELILVNDGSPDRCGEICEEYAKRDSRVKVIHKHNGGQASARNMGLDIACGKYIGFVDSDDWIEPDMYEILYNLCETNGCDIANCTSKIHFKDRLKVNGTHSLVIHNRNQAMKAVLEGELYDEVVWTKLIRRELLEDVRFPVGIIYEDTAFTYKVIHRSQKVCSIGAPKYNYVKHEGSTMDKAVKNIKIDAVLVYDEMFKFIKKHYPELTNLVALKLSNSSLTVLKTLAENNNFNGKKSDFFKVANILNSYFHISIKLSEYPRNVKLLLTVLKINPIIYKWVIGLINLRGRSA